MKNYFCISLISLFPYFLISSHAQVTFHMNYGGTTPTGAKCAKQTADEGYIIAGNYGWSGNAYLLKTDSNGTLLWTKIYSGGGGELLEQTNDGGLALLSSTLNNNIYMIKTDSDGNILWSKTYGNTADNWSVSFRQTSDHGFIILTRNYDNPTLDSLHCHYLLCLLKTDSVGNVLWTRAWGDTLNCFYGSSVRQTTDKGFVITGNYPNNSGEAFLLKTDSTGNFQWMKTYGNTSEDAGSDVIQNSEGDFVIAGWVFHQPAGVEGPYLFKTDSNGNLLWSKTDSTCTSCGGGSISQLKQTKDGGYIIGASIVTSYTNYDEDASFLRTDPAGNLLWEKAYYGTSMGVGSQSWENAPSIDFTTDGGFILASTNNYGLGHSFVFLIKTDSVGNSGCKEYTPDIKPSAFTTFVSSVTPPPAVWNVNTYTITPTIQSYGAQTTYCFYGTGIEENNSAGENISVSPNPTSGLFQIQVGNGQSAMGNEYKIEIYNVLGEKVTQSVIPSAARNLTIDVSSLEQGIYFLQVKTEQGIISKKMVVVK
ncbi:MAG: T9SS type A sorting domain-containing protein [Bacteroidetes bacterium]|nr:T9SS type A sorting domain-containing protein [Bacteroidota bacterium]